MKVKMLPVNEEDVINRLYVACRTCYSADNPINIWDSIDSIDKDKKLKLIKYIMGSGHTSILEVCGLQFLICGVDRSLTHQLVRHRVGIVFQQQSQRYVEFKDGKFDYVKPLSVNTKEKEEAFNSAIEKASEVYKSLVDLGVAPEDARSVLPNACCTNIVMTVNIRALGHICNERLCTTAQLPIRMLFIEIAKQVTEQLPFLKDFLVPKCEMLGYCNEPRRTCGRKSLKDDIIK